ncbi:MAG TPA: ABC transporter ATP-binding protein [Candidatus Eisenbacteria bacterium]|nr:ABC transporter ATP-binding protein [Candidatus Eisenbacteria bacterium]
MANLIEYDKVRKVYRTGKDELLALDEVSFDVAAGEFVTVVGRSGCGKSTLLKITAGLLSASGGSVRVAGARVLGPLTNIGIVFQSPVLLAWRKALDNVLLQIEARKLNVDDYREKAQRLFELTGLKGFEHKYPGELSGGMQQRVSISRALIHDPPLLLMDEPFGALDAITRDEMNLELLRIWQEAKKTVLFITHSIPEAVFLGDRVVVMTPRPGKVAEIVKIDLPRPRATAIRDEPQFVSYVKQIRTRLGVL